MKSRLAGHSYGEGVSEMLKTIAVFCGAAIIVLIAAATAMTPANAASPGCCMERDSTDPSSPWIRIPPDLADFEECQRLNEQYPEDQTGTMPGTTPGSAPDNILEPIGRIWWNIQC
jgi:hypothetical protein